MKVRKARKEAGANFVLLSQSRNMAWQFIKNYLNRPIKILKFLEIHLTTQHQNRLSR